jgi:hypothetical protein
MKIRQKRVLVQSAMVYELYDALLMLRSRHETPAVIAERKGITAQLLEYKLELVRVADELEREMTWEQFGESLIGYVTKDIHNEEISRREQWIRSLVLPVVAAVLVVKDYFEGMNSVSRVRLATPDEAVDKDWDIVVRFTTGHEYGVVVRRGSNEMRLRQNTVWFGLPYRYMDGLKVHRGAVHELDQHLFNEIEGVRMVRA